MTISGTKIEILLGERGMTRQALAESCGIKPQNISTILRRGTCSPVTATRLAKGLGVPVPAGQPAGDDVGPAAVKSRSGRR